MAAGSASANKEASGSLGGCPGWGAGGRGGGSSGGGGSSSSGLR